MGLRYHKGINLGGGVRLNVSKSGLGLSAGTRGARVSVGPRGVRKTVGIPGTGISYSTQKSLKKKGPTRAELAAADAKKAEKKAQRDAWLEANDQLSDDLSKIKLGPWYKLGPCIVWALILIPPLGIALMWIFMRGWKTWQKVLSTIFTAVWTIIWGGVTWVCSPWMEILLAVLYACAAYFQIRRMKLKLYRSMENPSSEGGLAKQ